MARTPNVKIIEWGTPPEPEPSGWDAIAAELTRKPGEWASLGAMSTTTARKVATDRLPAPAFETRNAAGKEPGKVVVWARAVSQDAPAADDVETRTVDLDATPAPRTVKRGGVV